MRRVPLRLGPACTLADSASAEAQGRSPAVDLGKLSVGNRLSEEAPLTRAPKGGHELTGFGQGSPESIASPVFQGREAPFVAWVSFWSCLVDP